MKWNRGGLLLSLFASRDRRGLRRVYIPRTLASITCLVWRCRPSPWLEAIFTYPSPRTTLFRPCLVHGHYAVSRTATALGPEEVGLVYRPRVEWEAPHQAIRSTGDMAFSCSWRRFQQSGVVDFNPTSHPPVASTGFHWRGQANSVCFLAAHDADVQMFMAMKRTILPSTRRKTCSRATSSSNS